VSHDVTSDRFFLVAGVWASRRIRVGHDLIGDYDGDAELRGRVCIENSFAEKVAYLIRQTLECTQELAKMTLTGRQFTSSGIVRAVQSRTRINNKQTKSDHENTVTNPRA
jgi:hypothetical protein